MPPRPITSMHPVAAVDDLAEPRRIRVAEPAIGDRRRVRRRLGRLHSRGRLERRSRASCRRRTRGRTVAGSEYELRHRGHTNFCAGVDDTTAGA